MTVLVIAAIALWTMHVRDDHARIARTKAVVVGMRTMAPGVSVVAFDLRGEPRISAFLSPAADRGEFQVIAYAEAKADGSLDAQWFDGGREIDQPHMTRDAFAYGVRLRANAYEAGKARDQRR